MPKLQGKVAVVTAMPLLVTSAAGANGDGYGALLAFGLYGRPLGAFSDDSRIADPRGLAVDRKEGFLFLNSGADWVLALDPVGGVARDTGPIEGLNPGGGIRQAPGKARTDDAFRSISAESTGRPPRRPLLRIRLTTRRAPWKIRVSCANSPEADRLQKMVARGHARSRNRFVERDRGSID